MDRRQFLGVGAASVHAPRAALAGSASGLQTGFAETDITPEIGMEQPSGYKKYYHSKFHDACKVRAAVFDDGERRVALVGVDALLLPPSLISAARPEIHQRTGIDGTAVLISASHTHSGGPTAVVFPSQYDHASAWVQDLAYKQSSLADADYLRKVQEQIVEAVAQADGSRSSASLSFGSGDEGTVAFNRRFRMKNGLTFTHPGQGNPDIVEVAGPIDPEVGVIGSWSADGKLAGCVVNYACHGTTGPGGISADWIYYMEQTIRGAMGDDVVVVFLQGFSGDVTQVDNLSPHVRLRGEASAKFVGGRIGAEAVKVLVAPGRAKSAKLDVKTTNWTIPQRIPSPEKVRRCTEIVKRGIEQSGATEWAFAKETVLLAAAQKQATRVPVEMQAIQIGPAAFVATPGEMFCQPGLDIKAGSRFPFTYPCSLANGFVGYVPTGEALGEHGGGYETRLTSVSNLEVTAATQMVDKGLELLKGLSPEKPPEPPEAGPFGAPWSYGNVGPEIS